jgi:dTDP-4-amino-4,6-dideoxygalactose transaminase
MCHGVFTQMRERGVGIDVHYAPMHLQPHYRALGFTPGLCPEAEAYGKDAIALALFPIVTEDDQDQMMAGLRESL